MHVWACADMSTWCGDKGAVCRIILQELSTFHDETASLISPDRVKKARLAGQ